MEIRKATAPSDIAQAITIDEAVLGSRERAAYIRSLADKGGVSVAALHGQIQALCCLDHGYFFEKPFVSLLIVAPAARRRGLGEGLLSHHASAFPEVWTSTNQSNTAMRQLLDKARWRFCGELSGLDAGDPERFYRTV
ncbi:MAG: GNAT family N-acetyltransferase [Pseudomonadota bacterium]